MQRLFLSELNRLIVQLMTSNQPRESNMRIAARFNIALLSSGRFAGI